MGRYDASGSGPQPPPVFPAAPARANFAETGLQFPIVDDLSQITADDELLNLIASGRARFENASERTVPLDRTVRHDHTDPLERTARLDRTVRLDRTGALDGTVRLDRPVSGLQLDLPANHGMSLLSLLATWRSEIVDPPLPKLPELAVTCLPRRSVSAPARRTVRPMLGVVAAIGALLLGSASIGAQSAVPGDPLWPLAQVLYADHAHSVKAKAVASDMLAAARAALDSGDPSRASAALDGAFAQVQQVLPGDGQQVLREAMQTLRLRVTRRLASTATTGGVAARGSETPPGTIGGGGTGGAAPEIKNSRPATPGSAGSATGITSPVTTAPFAGRSALGVPIPPISSRESPATGKPSTAGPDFQSPPLATAGAAVPSPRTTDGSAAGPVETVFPGTTALGTTAPETTAPEITAPATTAPATTAPATTAPATTAPETTAPETTAPATTAPATTAPETTAPATTAPETTAPETTAPATTAPETTAPATTAPETTAPATTAPATAPPATTAPETAGTEATAPGTVPEATVPEATVPETDAPEADAPRTAAPGEGAPRTTASGANQPTRPAAQHTPDPDPTTANQSTAARPPSPVPTTGAAAPSGDNLGNGAAGSGNANANATTARSTLMVPTVSKSLAKSSKKVTPGNNDSPVGGTGNGDNLPVQPNSLTVTPAAEVRLIPSTLRRPERGTDLA